MKDMDDLINAICDNTQMVRAARNDLHHLAQSIDFVLGNKELAERLVEMGDVLMESAKAVGTAHSRQRVGDVDRQRQQIGETLSALLQRTTPE